MKRLGLLLILVLVACSSGPSAREDQAPKPAAQQADATFYREGLSGVDFSGLDSVQKERALQIMNGNKCACPCGMTIAKCRVDDKTCPKSPGMAAAVVAAVKAGQSDQQIVAALNAMRDQPAAAGAPSGPAQPVAKVAISSAGDPFLGPENGRVTVHAFLDFQCPFCSRAHPVIQQILQTWPSDVKVVFKQFPLVTIHPNARPAAIASIAAQKQNKFWEMHDLLFKNQTALDAGSLRRYAESVGLDMAAYDKAIIDPETGRFLDQEMMDGQKAGVGGTPTFFVDGVQSPNWDFGTMQKLIEAGRAGGDVSMVAGQMKADMMAQARRNQPPPVDPNKVYDIDTAGAPSKGPSSAPVTIVEFSDYQ